MIMSFHKIAKLTVQWILLHCGYVQLRDVILRILGKVPITILTYHLIGMNKHPNNVTPSTFRQQLEYLCKRYKVADIGDGVKVLCSGKRNSRLLCCITFDDGYESNMQFAVPILKEFCSSAIFFVASACITQHRPFPDDERRGLLDFLPFTWEQVITLQKQHFCIGSHTSTHTNCGEEKNLYEIGQSKDEIEKKLNSRVEYFAFPYGRPDSIHSTASFILKESGYTAGFSCFGGVNYPDKSNILQSMNNAPIFKRIHISEIKYLIEFEFQLRLQEVILLRRWIKTLLRKKNKEK